MLTFGIVWAFLVMMVRTGHDVGDVVQNSRDHALGDDTNLGDRVGCVVFVTIDLYVLGCLAYLGFSINGGVPAM